MFTGGFRFDINSLDVPERSSGKRYPRYPDSGSDPSDDDDDDDLVLHHPFFIRAILSLSLSLFFYARGTARLNVSLARHPI